MIVKDVTKGKERSFAEVISGAYRGVKDAIAKPAVYAYALGFAVSPALAKAAEMKQHASSDINTEVFMAGYAVFVIGIGIFFGNVMRKIDNEQKREHERELQASQKSQSAPIAK